MYNKHLVQSVRGAGLHVALSVLHMLAWAVQLNRMAYSSSQSMKTFLALQLQ